MEPFPYLAGFSTFICTLAMAHLLKGLSDLFEVRHRVKWSWVYLALLALFVPLVAVEWWVIFRWRFFDAWTLFYFFFLIFKPILLYFAATLLIPRVDEHGTIDLADYLASIRPLFFGVLTIYALLDIVDTLLKGWDYFVSLLPVGLLGPLLLSALHLSVALTRSRRYLAVYVVVFWLLVIIMPLMFTSLGTLE